MQSSPGMIRSLKKFMQDMRMYGQSLADRCLHHDDSLPVVLLPSTMTPSVNDVVTSLRFTLNIVYNFNSEVRNSAEITCSLSQDNTA
ncbi:hypothetical protein L798_01122 [Zootermopsis nevadensis]|uniref:Uncharacterized protein n=1 Tax=Zootermopsis nevadensis TaxID=136037 RepID=A0A067RBA6_ZOONE|nr:hypothetical protein L798_01122 [Zootermopsis nevadensis]